MGARFVQDKLARIMIVARDKLNQIRPLVVETFKKKYRPAIEYKLTPYRSVIEKLLDVGRLASPVISFHASQDATKCAELCLHHLRSLNTTLRTTKKFICAITYLPGEEGRFRLEAVFNALMRTTNKNTNVREGKILFRRNGEVLHTIGGMSRLAKRVTRSTSAAELFTAAHIVDKLTYLKLLVEENPGTKIETTELILKFRLAFHLCFTLKQPEEN